MKKNLLRDQLSAIVPKSHPPAQREAAIHRLDLKGYPINTMRYGYGLRPMIG